MKNVITILLITLGLVACSSEPKPDPDPIEPGPLMAAAASVDVTPIVETFEDLDGDKHWDENEVFEDLNGDGEFNPIWIAGFGMDRPAIGVHDPIEARILLLAKDELRIAIVSVDWVGLLYDDALWLRDMAEAAGLKLSALLLTSTHNHEGPDTVGIWGPGVFASGRDPEYLASSFTAIVEGLKTAEAELSPVRVMAGLGQTEGLIHDSRLPHVIDETVLALRLERLSDDSPVAIVVHWGNHPECLDGDNPWISSDFPGAIRRHIEQAVPEAVAIYWQGMVGGLMNPLHVDVYDEEGQLLPNESFEKTERMGQLVAEEALAALGAAEDISDGGKLAIERRELLFPADNPELILAVQIGLTPRTTYDAEGVTRPVHLLRPPYFRTEAYALDIGLLRMVTVPGELYPESALLDLEGNPRYQTPQDPGADYYGEPCEPPIYASLTDKPYKAVLGLTNDELGYLVPKCQYDNEAPFAYERTSAQYGEGFCVNPELSEGLLRALHDAIGSLNTRP